MINKNTYNQLKTDCDKWYNLSFELQRKNLLQFKKLEYQKETIKEMREILVEVGASSHKSKKLFDWYNKNKGEL